MYENIEIFRSLCQIWKPEWQGMVMAELEYEAGERRAPLKIQAKEGRLVKIMASYGETGEKVRMLLLPAKGKVHLDKAEQAGGFWKIFAPQEVRQFSSDLGDHNEIHQGNHPIVSGFQLLMELRKNETVTSMKIRFHSSIYAGEKVYLEKEGDTWMGYTDHLCFTCWLMR